MFARVDSLQVKTNAGGELARVFENEIIPALRQQPGFKDEIVFADPGGPEVIAISLWSSREDAETYAREAYLGLLSRLATLIERAPAVRTFQLAYSSLHPAGVATFPSQSAITTPIGSPGA
ncbi:MAG: antibiotic biosynthesis monooxygenase family protein [Myxococcales bacterium]